MIDEEVTIASILIHSELNKSMIRCLLEKLGSYILSRIYFTLGVLVYHHASGVGLVPTNLDLSGAEIELLVDPNGNN
jgi:hypothetical protein